MAQNMMQFPVDGAAAMMTEIGTKDNMNALCRFLFPTPQLPGPAFSAGLTDTVVDPGTVVVKFGNAAVTDGAMLRTHGPTYQTGAAELVQ